MKKKAVVLLSGGLDSTTVLAIALKQGYEPITLCFDYGQRHRVELEKSRVLSRKMGALEHKEVKIDLRQFGGSALTTDHIEVPKGRNEGEMTAEIPITYVPARNTIFLSLALAAAEAAQAQDIFIGVTAIDYSGYPDCRPEYIQAFEQMANLGTKAGVEGTSKFKIHTPLIKLSKGEIIKKGLELGVDYSLTHSCYHPNDQGHPCGQCDSCLLRKKGFDEVGVGDPLNYQNQT
ncbi:MAG: 7-cyano-7-deazaguanine synthase QueC [Candidatus Tectomicrobia bacterium]|nr:7-cyano-7-deazaguanine synthase QueC [Candidatus Tectomicrobia bacterium]